LSPQRGKISFFENISGVLQRSDGFALHLHIIGMERGNHEDSDFVFRQNANRRKKSSVPWMRKAFQSSSLSVVPAGTSSV